MQPLNWQITKFNHIHSYPSDVGQGSELYAQDMVNLRVDRWGHLRPRPPIRSLPLLESSLAPEDVGITGVASDSEHLYWFRDDGRLFKNRAFPSPSTEREITDVDSLSGRLSVVQIGDFVIFTSEGHDDGYILYESTDTKNGQQAAQPLSAEAPDISGITQSANFKIVPTGTEPVTTFPNNVFYKFTYSDKNGNENPTTHESIPSDRIHAHLMKIEGDNNPAEIPKLLNIPKSTDSRMKWIFIYRSLDFYKDITADDTQILYYRAGRIEMSDDATYEFEDNRLYEEKDIRYPLHDNSPLPIDARRMQLYNGRLFAPNIDELRYSDLRFGVPHWSAWPLINSIRTGAAIDFCVAYRGYLLFGGRDSLYRLTGDSEYDFQVQRISARGPVSPYAWGILDNALGFVAVDGMYLTDGVNTQKAAPHLHGYFNRYYIDDGVVGQLPSETTFWGMTRRSPTGDTDQIYFTERGGAFSRLSAENAIQQLAIVSPNIVTSAGDQFDVNTHSVVAVADGYRAPRVLSWLVLDDSAFLADGFLEDNTRLEGTEQAIAWRWESQQLDWNSDGLGEMRKTFKYLEISGLADPAEITVKFYIDDKEPITETVALDRETGDKFRPLRIRINRKGFSLRFSIAGEGDITLRGLKLMAWV